MAHFKDLEDVFGAGILPVEEIQIDEEEEAKQYALSLYERVTRLYEKKEIEQEACRSTAEAGQSKSLILGDDSATELEQELINVDTFIKVDDDKYKVVPNLKAGQITTWSNTRPSRAKATRSCAPHRETPRIWGDEKENRTNTRSRSVPRRIEIKMQKSNAIRVANHSYV